MEAAGPCASPPGDRGLAGTDIARDHVTFTGPTTPMTTVWTDARGHGRLRCFSRCPSPGETQSDGLQS